LEERGSAVGKRWSWLAWSMLAVFVVSMVLTTILSVASATFQQDPAGFVVLYLGFSAIMVVGALVVAHRPSNAIGWIFSAVGLLPMTGALAAEYATYAYMTRPGSLPGSPAQARCCRSRCWATSCLDWWATLSSRSPIVFLPLAAGIAVLRYRLYDIDRLINRTLVYGLLTALLAGVYAGGVLVLGQVFGGVGGEPPSWVVAGATLAVAALFQPARHRIQAIVDRRFNRRKYNAARTVEAFSARLRDQVDLDALSTELLAVVDQTIQPTRASLWLRPADRRSLRTGT
jgi:hypothetical protein